MVEATACEPVAVVGLAVENIGPLCFVPHQPHGSQENVAVPLAECAGGSFTFEQLGSRCESIGQCSVAISGYEDDPEIVQGWGSDAIDAAIEEIVVGLAPPVCWMARGMGVALASNGPAPASGVARSRR